MHWLPIIVLCADAISTAEKLNLLGMLWYHGSKSKKEAEHALESNAMDCYFIREHASTLYLSTRYRGMFYHLPISKTKDGYVLKDHYNPFTSLQELVSHHQKHSVYVDSGEFTLQTSCHKGMIESKDMEVINLYLAFPVYMDTLSVVACCLWYLHIHIKVLQYYVHIKVQCCNTSYVSKRNSPHKIHKIGLLQNIDYRLICMIITT